MIGSIEFFFNVCSMLCRSIDSKCLLVIMVFLCTYLILLTKTQRRSRYLWNTNTLHWIFKLYVRIYENWNIYFFQQFLRWEYNAEKSVAYFNWRDVDAFVFFLKTTFHHKYHKVLFTLCGFTANFIVFKTAFHPLLNCSLHFVLYWLYVCNVH